MNVKIENLVALISSDPVDPCFKVIPLSVPFKKKMQQVTVNLEDGTWTVHITGTHVEKGKIGQSTKETSRALTNNGIIGVYDRTNIGHQNKLIGIVTEITKRLRG